jgi:hypothetical protein
MTLLQHLTISVCGRILCEFQMMHIIKLTFVAYLSILRLKACLHSFSRFMRYENINLSFFIYPYGKNES